VSDIFGVPDEEVDPHKEQTDEEVPYEGGDVEDQLNQQEGSYEGDNDDELDDLLDDVPSVVDNYE